MSSFQELRQKYDAFSTPAARIQAGGTDLATAGMGVREVSVDLSMGSACGACRFSLSGLYERGSRRIDSQIGKLLCPGSTVKVALGYGSRLTRVFTGYVADLGLQFGEGLTVSVSCLDARGLMREHHPMRVQSEKTLKKVLVGVFERYSALIPNVKLDVSDLLEPDTRNVRHQDDLSFITEQADLLGLDFYLFDDTAFLATPSREVCLTLNWEEYEFQYGLRYLNRKEIISGQEKGEPFTVEATAKQTAKQTKQASVHRFQVVGGKMSREAAQKTAKARASAESQHAQSGSVICAGLPEITLGARVKLTAHPLGALEVGDTMQISSVKHSFGAQGFQTQFGIKPAKD